MPPCHRVSWGWSWVKRSKIRSRVGPGDPRPVVPDEEDERPGLLTGTELDGAVAGVLQGVLEEVAEDAGEVLGIGVDPGDVGRDDEGRAAARAGHRLDDVLEEVVGREGLDADR